MKRVMQHVSSCKPTLRQAHALYAVDHLSPASLYILLLFVFLFVFDNVFSIFSNRFAKTKLTDERTINQPVFTKQI